MNTKWLAIAFAILLVSVLFVFFFRNDKNNQSFKSELTKFEVERVDEMHIYPSNNGEPMHFLKTDEGNWKLSVENNTYNASAQKLTAMLNSIASLKAKRLAAKREKSWPKFDVNDSLAVRVEVKADNESLAHIFIGKFKFSQAPQSNNPYQRNQGSMTSFVRLDGEDEVYAVEGFLKMTFEGDVISFRDQKVINVNKNEIGRIDVTNYGERFTLQKNEDTWLLDGIAADSTAAAGYLTALNQLSSKDFLSNDLFVDQLPSHILEIFGTEGDELLKVEALFSDSTSIFVRSNINPGTVFDGAQSGLFEKLFPKEMELRQQFD